MLTLLKQTQADFGRAIQLRRRGKMFHPSEYNQVCCVREGHIQYI